MRGREGGWISACAACGGGAEAPRLRGAADQLVHILPEADEVDVAGGDQPADDALDDGPQDGARDEREDEEQVLGDVLGVQGPRRAAAQARTATRTS